MVSRSMWWEVVAWIELA